jgi:hypothetical protein
MSDTHAAPAGGADTVVSVPVSTPAISDNSPISATEAARQLSNYRWKRDNPEAAKAEEAKQAPAAPEPAAAEPQQSEAKAEDAAPLEEAPGETPEVDPVVEEQPSIDPPRSWTKDAKEAFKLLPPALQKDVAELERSREVETRRGQNEVADARKAAEAQRVQAEQLRQQYEVALQGLHQEIQTVRAGEFGDIKTQADVERLANEDWPRFARWQAHQMKVDAVARESQAAQERQAGELKAKWSEYAAKQDQLLNDRAPELADKSKAEKLTKSAQEYLGDIGFRPEELAQAWNGEASLSLRDHRVQLLILDGVKFREAKAGAAKPAPKPVPPVQKPGTSKAPISAADAEVQTLKTAFERNPSAKNAAALLNAKRRSA